jgi:23S rRNA (uracil1939-C5)-methyltransferase
MLTAFLAAEAAELIAIEQAPDAVSDAELNLQDTENVVLYESSVEETLPQIRLAIDVLVADPPPEGLSREVMSQIERMSPRRVVYVSSDIATMARDGRHLHRQGYRVVSVLPIDMAPQTSQVLTVSLWTRT